MGELYPLKGHHVAADPRLGRVPEFDERSKDFPISALHGKKPLRGRGWYFRGWKLNQRQTSHCVPFAWHHEAGADPAPAKFASNAAAEKLAHGRYLLMQRADQWPGEEPRYYGTSVLAGAKVMRSLGYTTGYRWAFSLEDLLLAVGYEGPAVIGVNWYRGMMDPDRRGYLHPTGALQGGHAVAVYGVSMRYRRVGIFNSWNWQKALLSFDSMEWLFEHGNMDCCIPVGRKVK